MSSVNQWSMHILQYQFLYGIKEGRTDRSYGIHVAKIAGVPEDVVKRANELLETLTVHTQQASVESLQKSPAPQMSLFTEYLPSPLLDELNNIPTTKRIKKKMKRR